MARSAQGTRSSARVILLTLFHVVVLSGMVLFGRYLGEILVGIVMQPVIQGDLMSEWWQIFRKLAATLVGGLFLGLVIGYILLIWPHS